MAGTRRTKRRGVLTLEWIILITVMVIGVIGGLSAVRTATVLELDDLAEAISCISITEEDAEDKAGP